jgi:hypothetical protein
LRRGSASGHRYTVTNAQDAPLVFTASYETPLGAAEALEVVATYARDRLARIQDRSGSAIHVRLGSQAGLKSLSNLPVKLDAVVVVEDGRPTAVEVTVTSDEGPLRRSAALTAAYADLADDTAARLQRRSAGTALF